MFLSILPTFEDFSNDYQASQYVNFEASREEQKLAPEHPLPSSTFDSNNYLSRHRESIQMVKISDQLFSFISFLD